MSERPTYRATDIAIIGMAGRFPGAANLEQFWRNLRDGIESVTFFSDEELAEAGVPVELLEDPNYVKARPMLSDIDRFDAAFFGIHPKDAEILDPQHRLLLEVAWETMEMAGYDPGTQEEVVGVFAGTGMNTYLPTNLHRNRKVSSVSPYQLLMANDKDYAPTRISYKLGLTGPSVQVSSACSTSLVAVHAAVQSLINGECTMALAGGASVHMPREKTGYLHLQDMPASPDGHCRAFDAEAKGTPFGSGVGMVLLKPANQALQDRDPIHGIIKGTAVNNDGNQKVGYTAPSEEGQSAVVAEALEMSGLNADAVTYVEAHGTGTPLGDPIEVVALTKAFRETTKAKGFCALGTVKSNFGHLDAAAGIAGLLKTVLALKHGLLPPSLHFKKPNPNIDFANSPFYVNTKLQPWPKDHGPQCAGVSSFGIGGTNAHMVLEEPPAPAPTTSARDWHLLLLSAKTDAALERLIQSTAAFLQQSDCPDLADVAYTLVIGRKRHQKRRFFLAPSGKEAALQMQGTTVPEPSKSQEWANGKSVVFLLKGERARPDWPMAAALYRSEPAFRKAFDECSAALLKHLGLDLRVLLEQPEEDATTYPTGLAHCGPFITHYAMAKMWGSWGLKPAALLGYGSGEITAACLAGVFDLDDAAGLIAVQEMTAANLKVKAAFSVALDREKLETLPLEGYQPVAEESDGTTIISGPAEKVEALASFFCENQIPYKQWTSAHPFHSKWANPALDTIADRLQKIRLNPPRLPMTSTLTGDWLDAASACNRAYWTNRLRKPIRFALSLNSASNKFPGWLLDMAPRMAKTEFLETVGKGPNHETQFTSPWPLTPINDAGSSPWPSILHALGCFWTVGIQLDWKSIYRDAPRRRVCLPTYPFEPNRFWINPPKFHGLETQATRAPDSSINQNLEDIGTKAAITAMIEELTGSDFDPLPAKTHWLDLDLDSVSLIQFAQMLKTRFHCALSLQELMDQYGNLDDLAAYLESHETCGEKPAENDQDLPAEQPPTGGHRDPLETPSPIAVEDATGPFRPMITGSQMALDAGQRRFLDQLTESYCRRTAGSKEYAGRWRPQLADYRNNQGYGALWKEMVYPIIIERAVGSHLWDIDRNRYIDLFMGYGVNLFGHSPEFIKQAMRDAVEGDPQMVGPQTPLSGKVAHLFCQLTEMDRVNFCNTGSEAVMLAIRLARTATGRHKIAYFKGSYHGNFDTVLIRRSDLPNRQTLAPISPGIPNHLADDVAILDYGQTTALTWVEQNASQLAAVLVEPIQSRFPDRQPQSFLKALRQVATDRKIPLIFDEVITGFRIHPRGAQGHFEVRADLATYGKVIGGGMPIGAVAGSAKFMDSIDGGSWLFEDGSVPGREQTFSAGTFCQNPLAMAGAWAVLSRLQAKGPQLQTDLSTKARNFADQVNRVFEKAKVPLKLDNCGSMLSCTASEPWPFAELIPFLLMDKGIRFNTGMPNFLSTAHDQEDLNRVIAALAETLEDLKTANLTPSSPGSLAKTARGVQEEWPLSEAQREIWLATQMSDEASCFYHLSLVLTFEGLTGTAALQKALSKVVQRHEALRLRISADGSQQYFDAGDQGPLNLVDLSVLPKKAAKTVMDAMARYEQTTPFNLVEGPLWRGRLVKMATRRHNLVLTFHHLICDGWSSGVVLQELGHFFSQELGLTKPETPKPFGFRKYLSHMAQLEKTPVFKSAGSYWRRTFETPVAPVNLPADRRRPSQRASPSRRLHLTLDQNLYRKLKTYGSQQGSTLYMVLLSGFSALLQRLSAAKEMVVGTPIPGQLLVGQQNLVGHCAHLLPLRIQVHGSEGFHRHLKQIKEKVLEANQHQSYTYGELIRDQGLTRSDGGTPLISAILNLERWHGGEIRFPGLKAECNVLPKAWVTFDLVVDIADTGDQLYLATDYNAAVYREKTVKMWLRYYLALLEAAVAHPETRLASLPLANQDELHRVLAQLNQGEPAAEPRDPVRKFERMAALTPDAVALTQLPGPSTALPVQHLTYGSLNQRADTMAKALLREGARPGQPIAVCALPGQLETIMAWLGILKLGCAYLYIDPRDPPKRRNFTLMDARIKLVITQDWEIDPLPDGVRQVNHGALLERNDEIYSQTAQGTWSALDLKTLPVHWPAYLIYTSGSTGHPKGVTITRKAIAALVGDPQFLHLQAGMRIAQDAHFAFDATTFEVWGALLNGATAVLVPPELVLSPDDLATFVRGRHIDVMFLTTALLHVIAQTRPDAFTTVKTLLWGGEAVLPQRVAEILSKGPPQRLLHVYGPTEDTTFSTWHKVTRIQPDTVNIPIGRPLSAGQAYVLDKWGQPVPPGLEGELFLGGIGLASSYCHRPAETASAFLPNCFTDQPGQRLYRTGDRVRLSHDYRILFVGRADHQLKLRGFRVEPGEIEAALTDHPQIEQALVVPQKEPATEMSLAAYFKPVANSAMATSFSSENVEAIRAIKEFLAQRLPAFMMPTHWVPVERFPLNANGKIDRGALPNFPELTISIPYRAPISQTEQTLVGFFEKVLRVQPISVEANFFDLGGTSLQASQIIHRIRDAFQIKLPLAKMFEKPIISNLAEFIDNLVWAAGPQESEAPAKSTQMEIGEL